MPGAVWRSGLDEGWLSGNGRRWGRWAASPLSFMGPKDTRELSRAALSWSRTSVSPPDALPGVTWLFVSQLPFQVALLQLFQRFGEPLVMGQAGRAHRANGFHPIGAVASSTVVTCNKRAGVRMWHGPGPRWGLPPSHSSILAGPQDGRT